MPRKAQGKHPANVQAVIITPEEREAKLAEAPPGGGGTGPGANVSTHYVPNTFEEQAQDMSDQLIGRAALITARKLGVPYVWSTKTHKKITLQSGETICRKNPGLIYFDFDALEDIVAQVDQEAAELQSEDDANLEGDEYVESDELETDDDESIADLSDPAVMAELEQTAELEIDPNKEVPIDDPLAPERAPKPTRAEIIENARQEALQETALDPEPSGHVITETERRAWGGTFSTPGIQVYFHPQGITRVDVEGRVKLQTGIVGNVRTFRIQALERPTGGEVRNISRTTVTGPKAPAQPPKSKTRQMQERIPIPVAPKIDLDDGTDY